MPIIRVEVGPCDFDHLDQLAQSVADGLQTAMPSPFDWCIFGLEPEFMPLREAFDNLDIKQKSKFVENLKSVSNHIADCFSTDKKVGKYFEKWIADCFALSDDTNQITKPTETRNNYAHDKVSKYLESYQQAFAQKGSLTNNNAKSEIDLLLKQVLVSACSFGGLASIKPLEALYEELTLSTAPMRLFNDRLYFDLYYKEAGHPSNIAYSDKDNTSLKRWYVDRISKLALTQFYAVKNRLKKEHSFSSLNQIIYMIYRDIGLNQREFSIPTLLKQMFDVGLKVNNVAVPEFLRTYAFGEVFCGSTEAESLALYEKTFDKPAKIFVDKVAPSNSNESKSRSFKSILVNLPQQTSKKNDLKFIRRLLLSCESERDNVKRYGALIARKKLIGVAKSLLENRCEMSIQAEILIAWILDGLTETNRWQTGKNTAHRYLNLVYQDWLDLWDEVNITEVDESDADYFYELILVSISKKQQLIYTVLPLLYEFISKRFATIIALPERMLEDDKLSHVRSKLVPPALFHRVREDIYANSSEMTDIYRTSVDLMMVLIYRCGFRPSEIYKMSISQISITANDCIILSGKTASAARNIPLSLFLLPDELKALKSYVSERLSQKNSTPNSLLFSQESALNVPFDFSSVNRKIIKQLFASSNQEIVFYQFRHTCISTLILICFAEVDTAIKFTDYSKQQIEAIKAFLTSDPRKTLMQISAIVGHLSSRTTLTSYAHLCDLCLIDCLDKAELKLTLSHAAKLLNTTKKKAAIKLNLTDTSDIEITSMTPLINQKLQKYTLAQMNICSQSNSSSFSPSYMQEHEPTFKDFLSVVRFANDECSSNEIANNLRIPITRVKQIIKHVELIQNDTEFKTSKSYSTIFREVQGSKQYRDYYRTPFLEDAKFGDAEALFSLLTQRTKVSDRAYHLLSDFLITPLDHNYLIFNSFQEVKKFVNQLQGTIPLERWHVEFKAQQINGKTKERVNKAIQEIESKLKLLGKSSSSQINFSVSRLKKPVFRITENLRNKMIKERFELRFIDLFPNPKFESTNTLKVAVYWAKIWREIRDKKVFVQHQYAFEFNDV
ncbi:tyrosine-type recombinase/integrase [Paraglaciecola aestuariivivens]